MSRWFSFWRAPYQLLDYTGPYSIGCTDLMTGPNNSSSSGSFIRLYYPADSTADGVNDGEQCRWLPRREYADGLINFMKMPLWLGRFLHWCTGSIRTPAVWNAPLIPRNSTSLSEAADLSTLPCIVFSPGLGGNRYIYSVVCGDLASHGCVVACVEHRDQSASATYVLKEEVDGAGLKEEWIPFSRISSGSEEFELRNKQVHRRAQESSEALNILEKLQHGDGPQNLLGDSFDLACFKGRLDLNKVAMVGHSFGGATTVKTLIKDKRFRCGVALDVWMLPLGNGVHQENLDKPILFVNTEQFHRWRSNMEPLKKLIKAKQDERPIIAVRGTGHMDQSDITSALPPYMLRVTQMANALDPQTAVNLNREATWAFVRRHLGIGESVDREPILDGGEAASEHVVFGTNMDVTNNHTSQL